MKRFITLALLSMISAGVTPSTGAISRTPGHHAVPLQKQDTMVTTGTPQNQMQQQSQPQSQAQQQQQQKAGALQSSIETLKTLISSSPTAQGLADQIKALVNKISSELSAEQVEHFKRVAHEMVRNASSLANEKKNELLQALGMSQTNRADSSNYKADQDRREKEHKEAFARWEESQKRLEQMKKSTTQTSQQSGYRHYARTK